MDLDQSLRFVLALVFVLGLIFLLAYVLRRVAGRLTMGRGGRRLGVVETLSLDPRRRLVLVRHDDVEHLLLLGGSTDVVVTHGGLAPPPPQTSPAGDASTFARVLAAARPSPDPPP